MTTAGRSSGAGASMGRSRSVKMGCQPRTQATNNAHDDSTVIHHAEHQDRAGHHIHRADEVPKCEQDKDPAGAGWMSLQVLPQHQQGLWLPPPDHTCAGAARCGALLRYT